MARQTPPNQRLVYARSEVAARCPYFTSQLYNMIYVKVPSIRGKDTFAVTKYNHFLYTEGALAKWTDEEIAGVVEHEIYHVLFDDCETTESLGLNPILANWAQDIRINDILKRANRVLPPTDFYSANPKWGEHTDENGNKAPGFPPNLSFIEYYDLLKDKFGPAMKKAEELAQQLMDDIFGHCGSGAGNEVPEEEGMEELQGKPKRSQEEIDQVRQQIAEAVQQAAKEGGSDAGYIPSGLLRWADSKLKPPTVNWRDKLRRRLTRAVKYVEGQMDYSYHRMARRQCVVGYGARSPILPATRAPSPDIIVVIDTSGSMSESELADGLGELAGIFSATRGNVQFMSCDAASYGVHSLKNWREALKKLEGGGGTNFQPAFDEIARLPRRDRPHLCVFVTDGYPYGEIINRTPKMKTIWCVTNKGPTDFANFGEFIHIGDQANSTT